VAFAEVILIALIARVLSKVAGRLASAHAVRYASMLLFVIGLGWFFLRLRS
jgi:hypothetical protein